MTAAPWSDLLAEVETARHGAQLGRLARRVGKLARSTGAPPGAVRKRVALVGGASLEFLEGGLRAALAARGVWAELHLGGYDQALAELLDPDSATSRFDPDVVIVAFPSAEVVPWPDPEATPAEAEVGARALCDRYLEACRAIRERCGAEVVMDDFPPRMDEGLGNLAASTPASARSFLRRASTVLADRAPAWVHVHDVRGLVEEIGLERWLDLRFWYHAKQPVSFDELPRYVRSLSALVASLVGRSCKLLVTDLDNTLWGGVIGDDGLGGIELGEGTAAGEAHKAYQLWLGALRRRGVLLAVCSKNDPEIAKEPFREHPEMQLGLEDFVAFEAGWGPKSEGLVRIAEALDLGLDSMVFVDDNPAERAQVRAALPEVQVPELPDDASEYVRALARSHLFEVPAVAAEDAARTEAYRARGQARQLQRSTGDYESFLRELEMVATVRPFEPASMTRIAQLVGKTNQFNLTTERLTRARLEELAADPAHVTRTLRLRDRFGDHGLVSVVIGRREGEALELRLWLMSCRVLQRRVEELLLDVLCDAAERAGARELRGTYAPTPRNGIVRDLYPRLGFAPLDDAVVRGADGATRWCLSLADRTPLEPPIEIE